MDTPAALAHSDRVFVSRPMVTLVFPRRGADLGCGPILDSASDSPHWRMRQIRVLLPMPSAAAQSSRFIVRPAWVRTLDLRVFLICSGRVAHRQLSGEYPDRLSFLSTVWTGDGAGPMSERKVANESSHARHTVIPRPP